MRQPFAQCGGFALQAFAFARQMRAFLTQRGGALAQLGLLALGGFQLGLRGADGVVLRRRRRVGDKGMLARAAQRAGFTVGKLRALFFQRGDALARGVLGAAGFQRRFPRGDEFFLRGNLRRQRRAFFGTLLCRLLAARVRLIECVQLFARSLNLFEARELLLRVFARLLPVGKRLPL